MKFSIKDFFNKCDQICSFLWIWSHLLKNSFMENFIFCAVYIEKLSFSPIETLKMLDKYAHLKMEDGKKRTKDSQPKMFSHRFDTIF